MDPVAQLRAQLDDHRPGDATERSHLADLWTALDRYRRPLDERAQATHVTGSAIVLADDGGAETVLVHHKRLHRWLQPGGHVEPGETVHDAALREATEETGLALRHPHPDPRLVHVHVHDGGRGHRHLDVRYLLVADRTQPFDPDEGESRRLDWFTDARVAELADESVTAALAASRADLGRLVRRSPRRGPQRVTRRRSGAASHRPPRPSP